MVEKKSISVCITIDDDFNEVIKTIESIKDIANEVVLLGKISSDNDINLINKYNNKIIECCLDENLTKQRNILLEVASSTWILFLDPGDILTEKDKRLILKIIENKNVDVYRFKNILTFSDGYLSKNVLNEVRLIRNNNEYEFKGVFGEDLHHKFLKTDYLKFKDARIKIVKKKLLKSRVEKHIKSSIDELTKYNNNYYKFRLINYYTTIKMYDKAIEISSTLTLDDIFNSSDWFDNLLLKLKLLLITNNYLDFDNIIKDSRVPILEKPELYHYISLRYLLTNYNYMAIKYLSLFISKKDKVSKEYLNDTLLNFSFLTLANLYYKEKAYSEALGYYDLYIRTLKFDLDVLYKYTDCLFKVYDKEEAFEKTKKLFNLNKVEGLTALAEILFMVESYDYALQYFLAINNKSSSDKSLIKIAEILMLSKEYEKAEAIYYSIPATSLYSDEVYSKLIIISLLNGSDKANTLINSVKNNSLKVALNILAFKVIPPDYVDLNYDEILNHYIELLNLLLKTKEYTLFKSALEGLSNIKSSNTLRALALLYEKNNYIQLAKEKSLLSIEATRKISKGEIDFLYHNS